MNIIQRACVHVDASHATQLLGDMPLSQGLFSQHCRYGMISLYLLGPSTYRLLLLGSIAAS